MKSNMGHTPENMSPSQQIDAIIMQTNNWKRKTLTQLRTLIRGADPSIIEEVKWKKPSNPMGVPVWSHEGIVCLANTLKNAVRLTFPKGARIHDPTKLFNARLDSKTVRAVDFREGANVDEDVLVAIVKEAVDLNSSSPTPRGEGES